MENYSKKLSLLFISLFLLGQLSTSLHFLLVPHHLSLNGLNAIHFDKSGQHSDGDHKSDKSDNCNYLSLLISPNVNNAPQFLPLVDNVLSVEIIIRHLVVEEFYETELFNIAPSNSPPVITG
ncbi:MAG: hypothetical protein JXR91_09915 [Deltaproteobacteria bacterium]|nr:hypothetical protein [Deltaproteobacteria bacterium]